MDKKGWVILIAASAAVATAGALLVVLRRSLWGDRFQDVPDLISDCYDRIRDLEIDLEHLRPNPQPAV